MHAKMMTVDWCSTRFFWTSAFVFLVLAWSSPSVIGSDRGRTAKCPADLATETRQCLTEYTDQMEALLLSDNRFFPGLDVEVIRSLCSLLDDSMRCVRNTLIENCPKQEQQQTIEHELGPHLAVRQLCIYSNIYEEYAMNQNCFVRIRPESEICYRNFMVACQDDELSSSSSSLSSSQRHQTTPQLPRSYCFHLKRLIACVKSLVRSSTTSCQKTALRLVEVLVRASFPSTDHCRDEPNPTASAKLVKASDRFEDTTSSGGRSLQGSVGGLQLNLFCFALASLVCLQSFFLHVFGPSAPSLFFHRSLPPTTALPPSPPSSHPHPPHRRRLHHHRFSDLLFS